MEVSTLNVSYATSGDHIASITVVLSETTIEAFKQKLQAACSTPARYQRLVLQRSGEELKDSSKTLSVAGVTGDDELQLAREMPNEGDLLNVCKDQVEPSMELVEYIMSANENFVNFMDEDKWTCLHHAVCLGRQSLCEALLTADSFNVADALAPIDFRGWTALHMAVIDPRDAGRHDGHESLVCLLLESPKFTAVNSDEAHFGTALHVAARYGRVNICRILLESPAFGAANSLGPGGNTALAVAIIACSEGSGAICRLLLDSPKFNQANAIINGKTALHMACSLSRREYSTEEGDSSTAACSERYMAEICQALLESPNFTEVNAVTSHVHQAAGQTALHRAAYRGNSFVCKLLLESPRFTAVNAADANGWTALHLATRVPSGVAQAIFDSPRFTAFDAVNNDGDTAFQCAARALDSELCSTFLTSPVHSLANVKTNKGETALHLASGFLTNDMQRVWNTDICRILLESPNFEGANDSRSDGSTALHIWAGAKCPEDWYDIECMDGKEYNTITHYPDGRDRNYEKYLESMCHGLLESRSFTAVNAQNKQGCTALHLAAQLGYPKVSRALLQSSKFTAANAENKEGCTALHVAANLGSLDVVCVLLKSSKISGANATSPSGRTILHAAVLGMSKWEWTRAGVQYFEEDSDAQSSWGGVPVEGEIISANTQQELKKKGLWGPNYDAPFNTGGIVVSEAARQRQFAVCKHILELGQFTAADSCDEEIGTALTVAADHGHKEVFRLLLDSPKFHAVNAASREGRTALHGSARDPEMFQLLIRSSDFDVQTLDSKMSCGQTALHEAAKAGHLEICSQLLDSLTFTVANSYYQVEDYHDRMQKFQKILEDNGHRYTHILVTEKYDLQDLYKEGGTALHISLIQGHEEISRLLLESPKFTAVNDRHHGGGAVLHHAAAGGHIEICRLLLESENLNLNIALSSGETALHCAAASGHVEVCSLLLESTEFTSLNTANASGDTALHDAASNGHINVCSLLLELKDLTRLNSANLSGFTALDLACDHEDDEKSAEICKLILASPDFSDVEGNLSALYKAVGRECPPIETCKVLLDCTQFQSVNYKDEEGATALLRAGSQICGNDEMWVKTIRLLLESPRVHVNDVNNDMWTALHCVARWCTCEGEEPDMLRAFLESQAISQVSKANKKGETVLHLVVKAASDNEYCDDPEELEIAAEKACRLILESPKFTARDAKDEAGKTAFDLAVDSKLKRICKLLCSAVTATVDPGDIELQPE